MPTTEEVKQALKDAGYKWSVGVYTNSSRRQVVLFNIFTKNYWSAATFREGTFKECWIRAWEWLQERGELPDDYEEAVFN